MKGFFSIFLKSAKEIRSIANICVIGMLIALSMVIENFTIEIPFGKINFAYIAIAAIGMLYGPSISFLAGGICDIVGYAVHPVGAFMPAYTLIAMLQGLVYGAILYEKFGKQTKVMWTIRITIARVIDVLLINLVINTATNLHYGFISDASLSAAITARLVKNLVELPIDLVLLYAILPAVLFAYHKVRGGKVHA